MSVNLNLGNLRDVANVGIPIAQKYVKGGQANKILSDVQSGLNNSGY